MGRFFVLWFTRSTRTFNASTTKLLNKQNIIILGDKKTPKKTKMNKELELELENGQVKELDNNLEENKIFDLIENKKELEEELKGGLFFTLEEGVSYKVRLNTTAVRVLNKEFEKNGNIENVKKYELGISAKGSDGSDFEGVWEVGVKVMRIILKSFEKGAIFNVSRTGKGLNTSYSVTKDF